MAKGKVEVIYIS